MLSMVDDAVAGLVEPVGFTVSALSLCGLDEDNTSPSVDMTKRVKFAVECTTNYNLNIKTIKITK